MCKYWLIAALLLLAPLGNQAKAAEPPEVQKAADPLEPQSKQSKGARKALVMLGAIGIKNTQLKSLVETVDSRVKDGYFMIGEERVPGGSLNLHYQMSGGLRTKQLELRFTPDDSNWVATARTDGVMVSYSYKF